MIFDRHIDVLRRHCYDGVSHERLLDQGKRLEEIAYGLETLYGRDWGDLSGFRDGVRAVVLADVRAVGAEDGLAYETPLQKRIAEREEQSVLVLLDILTEEVPAVSVPYRRIFTGDEAQEACEKDIALWDAIPEPPWLWEPILDDDPPVPCLAVSDRTVKPCWESIVSLLCPDGERVLVHGLSVPDVGHRKAIDPYVAEIDRDYVVLDRWVATYNSMDYARMLYVSADGILYFAGDWIPEIRRILQKRWKTWSDNFFN
jgi:hypothetical protein